MDHSFIDSFGLVESIISSIGFNVVEYVTLKNLSESVKPYTIKKVFQVAMTIVPLCCQQPDQRKDQPFESEIDWEPVAAHEDIFVQRIQQQPKPELIQQVTEEFRQISRHHKQKAGVFVTQEEPLPPPTKFRPKEGTLRDGTDIDAHIHETRLYFQKRLSKVMAKQLLNPDPVVKQSTIERPIVENDGPSKFYYEPDRKFLIFDPKINKLPPILQNPVQVQCSGEVVLKKPPPRLPINPPELLPLYDKRQGSFNLQTMKTKKKIKLKKKKRHETEQSSSSASVGSVDSKPDLNQMILDTRQLQIRKFKRFEMGDVLAPNFEPPKHGFRETKHMKLNDVLVPTLGLSIYDIHQKDDYDCSESQLGASKLQYTVSKKGEDFKLANRMSKFQYQTLDIQRNHSMVQHLSNSSSIFGVPHNQQETQSQQRQHHTERSKSVLTKVKGSYQSFDKVIVKEGKNPRKLFIQPETFGDYCNSNLGKFSQTPLLQMNSNSDFNRRSGSVLNELPGSQSLIRFFEHRKLSVQPNLATKN